MTKGQLIYIGIWGALALVSLASPTLIVLGLFLGIVPGAILWASIPVFCYSLLAITVRNATFMLGRPTSWGLVAAAIATIAVLPPAIMNFATERAAGALTAGDRPLAGPLPKIRTLAYLGPHQPWRGRAPDCEDTCQRLLFNGSVEAVIAGAASLGDDGFKFPDNVALYRVERRPACPPVALSSPNKLLDSVQSRIGAGECIVREQAKLELADVVVAHASKSSGDRRTKTDDRVENLQRVALYTRTPQGLEEKFRRTSVTYMRVMIPFLYGYFSPRQLFPDLGIASARVEADKFDIAKVFADDFKLDVAAPADLTPQQDRELLLAAIADKARPASDPVFSLSDKILRQITAQSADKPGDVALIGSIVGDARVSNLWQLHHTVWKLGADASGLAGAFLGRIMMSDATSDSGIEQIKAVSYAVSVLPDGALVPVADKLKALAEDETRRAPAYRAITRLADGGKEMAPLLTDLLRSSWGAKNGPGNWNAADLQVGALIGLCRLGKDASSAAPALVALFNGSEADRDNLGPRGALLIRTLNQMGAWPQVRSELKASEKMMTQIDAASGRQRDRDVCRY